MCEWPKVSTSKPQGTHYNMVHNSSKSDLDYFMHNSSRDLCPQVPKSHSCCCWLGTQLLPKAPTQHFTSLIKGRFTWGPTSQVPMWRQSLNFWASRKPLQYDLYSLKTDLDYFMHNSSWHLCWELGLVFWLTLLSTRVLSLIFKKCCHAGIHVLCETWDPMWSG